MACFHRSRVWRDPRRRVDSSSRIFFTAFYGHCSTRSSFPTCLFEFFIQPHFAFYTLLGLWHSAIQHLAGCSVQVMELRYLEVLDYSLHQVMCCRCILYGLQERGVGQTSPHLLRQWRSDALLFEGCETKVLEISISWWSLPMRNTIKWIHLIQWFLISIVLTLEVATKILSMRHMNLKDNATFTFSHLDTRNVRLHH